MGGNGRFIYWLYCVMLNVAYAVSLSIGRRTRRRGRVTVLSPSYNSSLRTTVQACNASVDALEVLLSGTDIANLFR
jgi:hypothetical protein